MLGFSQPEDLARFERVYDHAQGQTAGWSFRMGVTPDLGFDSIQDIFLSVLRGYTHLPGASTLLKHARNGLRKARRDARRREPLAHAATVEAPNAEPWRRMEQTELRRAIRRVIATLTGDDRALVTTFLATRSLRQTARRMGWSLCAVQKKLCALRPRFSPPNGL